MAATLTASDRLTQQQSIVFKQMEMLMDAATKDGRAFDADEEKRFTELKEEHAQLTKRIGMAESDAAIQQKVAALTGNGARRSGGQGGGSTPGALFATNEAVRSFIAGGGHRRTGAAWVSPGVEIPYSAMLHAPTLMGTTLTEDPTSGGKLVVPQFLPGIVPTATRPLVVADLLMPGTTDSNSVVFMQETLFTNAAQPVSEGAAKPESALAFDQKTEPVIKIACWLPTTEELLEDVPAMAAYINGRLALGVQLAEDDQLLNGNGTAPNLLGMLNRPGLATTVVQGAGESAADSILRQIGSIAITANVPATGVIMNPQDWYAMLVLKTSGSGEYLGSSPFESPTAATLWGLPVAITPAIPAKTALVGAFATQVQWFRKGGIRVEASNSHQDFFVKNLVAIRAEERGALCVYRPGSLGKVTLL